MLNVILVRIDHYRIATDKPYPDEEVEVIEKLHESDKSVIGTKLASDSKYKDVIQKIDNALNSVLTIRTVDMIIVGFDLKGQIEDYLG